MQRASSFKYSADYFKPYFQSLPISDKSFNSFQCKDIVKK